MYALIHPHFDDSLQDCNNSIANALELPQSCILGSFADLEIHKMFLIARRANRFFNMIALPPKLHKCCRKMVANWSMIHEYGISCSPSPFLIGLAIGSWALSWFNIKIYSFWYSNFHGGDTTVILSLMGELWGVYYEDLIENWLRYNGVTLYMYLNHQNNVISVVLCVSADALKLFLWICCTELSMCCRLVIYSSSVLHDIVILHTIQQQWWNFAQISKSRSAKIPMSHPHITVTVLRCLQSPAIWLFSQKLTSKWTSKLHMTGLLWWESTRHWWIPLTKGL